MELASLLRPLGVVAGPAAVVAFGLFVAGMVTVGEDDLDGSLLATASSAAMLVTLVAIGAAALAALARLREAGRSVAGSAVAVIGSVLVAGGSWAALFLTGYGALVIAKSGALVLLGGLGLLTRRRMAAGRVPVLRWAGFEVTLMAVTLGLAAALSQTAP